MPQKFCEQSMIALVCYASELAKEKEELVRAASDRGQGIDGGVFQLVVSKPARTN